MAEKPENKPEAKKPEEEAAAAAPAKPEAKAVEAKAEKRLHPILSNEEYAKAQAEARARIDAERRKQAMQEVIAAETARLALEEGLSVGNADEEEMVTILIDLAEYCDRIQLNMPTGPIFMHGQTYTVRRHQARTLAEIMWRTHQHQAEIKGDGRLNAYKRTRDTVISATKGAINAPRPFNT